MNVMLDARIVATRVHRLDLGAFTAPFDWAACVGDAPRPDLSRPQPSERARREQRVDQPICRCLGGDAPGAGVPNRVLPERNRVPDECRYSDEPEYREIGRPERKGTSCDVCGKH